MGKAIQPYYTYELIVNEAEFNELNGRLIRYWAGLEEYLYQYEAILSEAVQNGVASGNRHEMLELYIETVHKLQNIVSGTAAKVGLMVQDFLNALEKADTYIYDAKFEHERYYDIRAFTALVHCIDHPLSGISDSVGDYLIRQFYELVEKYGWDEAQKKLHNCYALLMDYLNTSKQELVAIFDSVHELDANYGKDREDRSSFLGNAFEVAFCVNSMLQELADMLGTGENLVSPEDARRRLGIIWEDLSFYAEKVKETAIQSVRPTSEQIREYTRNSNVQKNIRKAESDIDHFLKHEAPPQEINDFVRWKEKSRDKLKAAGLEDMTYDEYLVTKRMAASLEEIEASADKNRLARKKDIEKKINESDLPFILDQIEKFGSKAADMTDDPSQKELIDALIRARNGDYGAAQSIVDLCKANEKLKDIIKGAEYAQIILKYGADGLGLLAAFTADYECSLEILSSLEQNCTNDQASIKAIGYLRSLYQKEAAGLLNKVAEKGLEYASDKLLKAGSALTKACIGKLAIICQTIDIAFTVTGQKDRCASAGLVKEFQPVILKSRAAWENAVNALDQVSPEDPEYEKLAENAYNCFVYHKQNLVSVYDAMSKAVTGPKAAYYRYCKLEISKMKMTDQNVSPLLSYQEFQNLDHEIDEEYSKHLD